MPSTARNMAGTKCWCVGWAPTTMLRRRGNSFSVRTMSSGSSSVRSITAGAPISASHASNSPYSQGVNGEYTRSPAQMRTQVSSPAAWRCSRRSIEMGTGNPVHCGNSRSLRHSSSSSSVTVPSTNGSWLLG